MKFLLVPLVILVVLFCGCLTTNRKHNARHIREGRNRLQLLHADLDKYLAE